MAEKEDYTRDKGDPGEQGPQGEQGDIGPQGPEGPPGTTDYEELENVPETFAPSAHKASHENGGADEISVGGLSGELADEQDAGKVKAVTVDDSGKADGKVLVYRSATETLVYEEIEAVGAIVKNIQPVNIQDVPRGWKEAAITGVDVDKTFLLYNGFGDSAGTVLRALPLVELKDSTTVRAFTYDETPDVYLTVVEFVTGIKSIQRGVTTITDEANPNDVTIAEVNLAKSFISWLGQAFPQFDDTQFREMRSLHLLNSTTLRMQAQAPLYDTMISWEVIEFE